MNEAFVKYCILNHINPNEANEDIHTHWTELNGSKKFIQKLNQVDRSLPICVCGDYDADGITATAIFCLILKKAGFQDVDYVIPERSDGYGLKETTVKKALEKGAKVLITCDNGIAALAGLQSAVNQGLKVFITDHHLAQNESIEQILELAEAVVNPHYHFDGKKFMKSDGFSELSGAQTAYKLAQGISEEFSLKLEESFWAYLKTLAAISVISDMMSLGADLKHNENRALVREGIKLLQENPDFRLAALMDVLGIHQSESTGFYQVDESTIGFYLAPALNASGRIASASIAEDLLLSDTSEKAKNLAGILKYLNDIRKEMKQFYCEQAKESLSDSTAYCIQMDMPEGMTGIIAGVLCEEIRKPCCIFAPSIFDGKKIWKASCRSPKTVDLFAILNEIHTQHPELLSSWGGHAQAAGISVEEEHFEKFNEVFCSLVSSFSFPDEEIHPFSLQGHEFKEFCKDLSTIKPFGHEFAAPQVQLRASIQKADLFYKSGHVKLTTSDRIEIWLYYQLEDFLQSGFLDDFKKIKDNTKTRLETMDYEEAISGRCEAWIAPNPMNHPLKIMEFIGQADWGWNMFGNPAPVLNVKNYQYI